MAEALRDLLGIRPQLDASTLAYVSYLAQLPVNSLQSSEPRMLSESLHSLLISIQGLSKRSHKPIFGSTASHALLRQTLPCLEGSAIELSQSVSRLDLLIDHFATNFNKLGESKAIANRMKTLKILENADRLLDLMRVPSLLVSAVNGTPHGYTSALELYTHIHRLAALYPTSNLVLSVLIEADAAVLQLAADLIKVLKAPSLKLAAALRTVVCLKRVIPNLASEIATEDVVPAVFLVCRLTTLAATLSALEPLRQLADEERLCQGKSVESCSSGQQTELYLKRFIEVFREHSFGIVSLSESVGTSLATSSGLGSNALYPLPSASSTFLLHLVNMLAETLRIYLPIVKDQASRESVLTQVLYCAGSLGRLGADFGMLLATTGVSEWVALVKRHSLLAERLESAVGDYRDT